MTNEIRTFIEAPDITGIEIECPKCRLSIFYPVDVDKIIKIAPACFNCGHHLFDEVDNRGKIGGERGYPGIDSIQDIAGQLRALKRKDRTDIHANIRLRLMAEAGTTE